MDNVNDFFATLSSILWGWPMIVLLLGTHVFLTVRLRFPQRKLFTAIRISVQRDKSQKGDVSQFGALATALAATIGTGNIIGVATAVALGGPGAVFWCWLTGVFGISTKYSEALLAIKYRVKLKVDACLVVRCILWNVAWDGVRWECCLPCLQPLLLSASAVRCRPMPFPR